MINFSHAPPDKASGYGLPLIRTPSTTPIVAALTCENLIGCNTHFWGGRTVPCDATDCEACANGTPWRWHGYVSAFDHRNRTHFLFEATARAAEPFKEWFEKYGTLRGAKFEAVRLQRRPNGRVQIRLKSIDLIEFPIPKEPNILAALAIIWNIPLPDLFDAKPIKGHEALGADRGVTALAKEWAERQKRDPSASPPTKANGDLLTAGEVKEVAEVLAKTIGGNGRTRLTPDPSVHE